MFKKALIFFSNPLNVAIWNSFNRLSTEIATFVKLNDNLTSQIQQHHTNTKGVTQTKNDAFMKMVTITVSKAQKASVWAMDTNNNTLVELFDVQKTDLTGTSEMAAFNTIKIIRDALNTNIGSMASVQLTAADVTALNDAITAYQKTIGANSVAQAHKTDATRKVGDTIKLANKSLDIIDKLIINSYSTSHPDIVKEYLANRVIEKLPTRHSGVYVEIVDATTGDGLEGAILAVNGKTTTSDIEGVAEIIKMKPGTYMATISMDGYTTHTVKVTIERARVMEMTVKMIKS